MLNSIRVNVGTIPLNLTAQASIHSEVTVGKITGPNEEFFDFLQGIGMQQYINFIKVDYVDDAQPGIEQFTIFD